MDFFNDVTPQAIANASDGFKEFRIGDNNAFIKSARETLSNSSNPMLEITFINDEGAEIKYYIVEGEYKLTRLKQLYTAFGIPAHEYTNLEKWCYKEGIVVCKQGEPYNGKVYNKVNYVRPKYPEQKPAYTPQNSVGSGTFSQPQVEPQQGQGKPLNDGFDDDIPF